MELNQSIGYLGGRRWAYLDQRGSLATSDFIIHELTIRCLPSDKFDITCGKMTPAEGRYELDLTKIECGIGGPLFWHVADLFTDILHCFCCSIIIMQMSGNAGPPVLIAQKMCELDYWPLAANGLRTPCFALWPCSSNLLKKVWNWVP